MARIESQIEKCQTSDELINTAATILKPWHLEAFLYFFVSDRDPSEPPLSIEFQKVIDTLYPKDDHRPLPEATERELLQVETELHDKHLEELFREEFGIELPKASSAPSRKRTFDRELKASSQDVIDVD